MRRVSRLCQRHDRALRQVTCRRCQNVHTCLLYRHAGRSATSGHPQQPLSLIFGPRPCSSSRMFDAGCSGLIDRWNRTPSALMPILLPGSPPASGQTNRFHCTHIVTVLERFTLTRPTRRAESVLRFAKNDGCANELGKNNEERTRLLRTSQLLGDSVIRWGRSAGGRGVGLNVPFSNDASRRPRLPWLSFPNSLVAHASARPTGAWPGDRHLTAGGPRTLSPLAPDDPQTNRDASQNARRPARLAGGNRLVLSAIDRHRDSPTNV